MIHGPCGIARLSSPCMKDGKCTKFFPKKFVNETHFDEDGYPVYRRRDTGVTVTVKDIMIDNRFVVPYNPKLLMKYHAHMNLEFCNKSNSIKYLFKYINKGPDGVTVTVTQRDSDLVDAEDECVDEIKQYYDCRYLSPCESAWRIFAFDIHQRWPPVQRLIFHLPWEQNVMFQETDSVEDILLKNRERNTMFIAWMEANKKYLEGKNLTYGEFPAHFVYNINRREWYPRKKGFCIGRLNFVPPANKDLFYLRLLLNVQKGCTSFEDLRTVGGFTHQTFREACYALGLLTDDREFIDAIKEAANLSSGPSLRRLFVTLLLSQSMNKPLYVWEQTWELLVDGILYEKRREVQRAGMS